MKKTWLTAVSVAGVLGTGSAAVLAGAVMNVASSAPTAAPLPQAYGSAARSPRTVVYTVGDAAQVTLSSAGGVLTVISTEAHSGWSVVSTSAAGPTVTAQLTDDIRLVTFTATANGDDVQASVTAAFVTPTTEGSPAPAPELIKQPAPAPVVAAPLHGDNSDAPAPLPAQPGLRTPHSDEPTATAAEPESDVSPAPVKTPPATTTAPSHAGANYADDGSGTDDHESVTPGTTQPGAEHNDD